MGQSVITRDASRAISILEEFRKVDPEIRAQTILTFLYVMGAPGISMPELSSRIGYSQPSTSRNVAALSEHHRLGRPGAGLLEAREDPEDRRQKLVWLTGKKQVFARELRELMK